MDAWYLFHSVVEMHGVYDHCGKQVEPEIGEIPVAFVANAKGSEFTEDDVKQFVTKEVIYYKKVREVTFVDKIPKAPSGKILRKELRKQLQQQQQVV